MNSIKAWFASKGGFSHVVVGVYVALIALYAGVPSVASLLNTIYAALPAWSHEVILAVLGAAAFYSNNDAATKSNADAAADRAASAGNYKSLGVLLVLGLAMLSLTGCSSFERNTFNSLSASKAVIDTAQKDYTAGTIKQTACTYAVINDAKAAQTVAVNSMLVYETAKNAGNEASVQLAVADIIPIIAEIKTLYTNPAGCSTGAYK